MHQRDGWLDFNPLRPRGRRLDAGKASIMGNLFQPTPPARTETQEPLQRRWPKEFQPTPPARTETLQIFIPGKNLTISTHSAREDGDLAVVRINSDIYIFQPTPPARTETTSAWITLYWYHLFQPTPPARTETVKRWQRSGTRPDFNPLRPRGRRRFPEG